MFDLDQKYRDLSPTKNNDITPDQPGSVNVGGISLSNQTDNWDLVGTVKMLWKRFGFANIPIDENNDGKASIPSKYIQPRPSYSYSYKHSINKTGKACFYLRPKLKNNHKIRTQKSSENRNDRASIKVIESTIPDQSGTVKLKGPPYQITSVS